MTTLRKRKSAHHGRRGIQSPTDSSNHAPAVTAQPYPATPEPEVPGLTTYRRVALAALILWAASYGFRTFPEPGADPHYIAWAFTGAIAFLFWGLIFLLVIPEIVRGVAIFLREHTGPTQAMGVGTVVVFLFLMPWMTIHSHGWQQPKLFDDTMAVSNTHVLLDNGLDTSKMFFRSFLRMGFPAAMLPIALHDEMGPPAAVRTYPEDGYRRVWSVYHDGREPPPSKRGIGTYPWISASIYLLALLMAPISFRIFQAAGVPSLLGCLAGYLATLWYFNSSEVLLTQAFTHVAGLVMALAYFTQRTAPLTVGRAITTGLAIGFGGLTMNTLGLIAAGIVAGQVADLFRVDRPQRRRYVLLSIVQWAIPAVLILLWYEAFLRGLIFELRLFKTEVAEVEKLMNFEPTTFSRFLSLMQNIYSGSIGLLCVSLCCAVGLVSLWRRQAYVPMLVWMAVAFASLATMPFLFARFLMYTIIPVTWFSASAIAFVGAKLMKSEK